MKLETWTHGSNELLLNAGFHKVKPHEYWCVRNEMLIVISFQGAKKDIYIWFAIYPLVMPEIWPSMGWGDASGRLPRTPGTLCFDTDKKIPAIQKKIANLVENEFLPFVNGVKSIESLVEVLERNESKPLAQFPRAFCLLDLGKVAQGFEALEQLSKSDKLSFQTRELVEASLAINEDKIESHLSEVRAANIKKLSLNKCIKTYNQSLQRIPAE